MAGFSVNYAPGKLVFQNGITLPNPAVRFQQEATLGLWFRNLVGDDVETVSGTVFYPRVERPQRADLPLEVSQFASFVGVATTNRQQQLKENLATLATISDLSESVGTQTVAYTPWIGATPVALTAVVLPPLSGSVLRGVGVNAAVVMIIEAAVSGDGP